MPEDKTCDKCLYRTEEFRDGGFCYMWREDPGHPCHQWEPVTVTVGQTGKVRKNDLSVEMILILSSITGLGNHL